MSAVTLLRRLAGHAQHLADEGPRHVQLPQPGDEEKDPGIGVTLGFDGIEQRLEHGGLGGVQLEFHVSSLLDASRALDARRDGADNG